MPQYPSVIYDDASKTHRPVNPADDEVVDPLGLPVSAFTKNRILRHSDGLYSGPHTLPTLITVDPDAGTDAEPSLGATTLTCRTLQYALDLIEARAPAEQAIVLKSGRSYPITRSVVFRDMDLHIAFFGDAKYGGINTLLNSSTKMFSQYQLDLVRPIIHLDAPIQDVNVSDNWYSNQIQLINSRVVLTGIQLNLLAAPLGLPLPLTAYSNLSCMFHALDSEVFLNGSIVNKPDPISHFGFFGVPSRRRSRLTVYNSQFRVSGRTLSSTFGATPDELANRQDFIKMLPDYPAINTSHVHFSLVPSALGPTAGSGLLDLHWTLTQELDDIGTGSKNLATFPGISAGFGIQNYIYGVMRDLQYRPLNVWSNFSI